MFDSRAGRVVTYLVTAALVLVLGVRVFGGSDRPEPARIALSGPATEPADATAERVWVDIAGAIRRPGLYRVPAGSRVGHVVERAGGLRRSAAAAVNLAAPVEDGQQIVVGTEANRDPAAAASEAAAGGPSAVPGSATVEAVPSQPRAEIEAAAPTGGMLSLSSATAEEIDAAAEGIGPTLASRIVEVRAQSGGFTSVDDLRQVPGIGEVRFQALAQVFGGGG